MGFLTVTRREGEMHVGAIKGHGQVRIGIDAPKQLLILRDELIDA